ncbi:MAG: GNAT family N-acetyltransferase [Rhizobium sp.]
MTGYEAAAAGIALIEPQLGDLAGFEDAMARGWSPDPRRQRDKAYIDTELKILRQDRTGFLARLTSGDVVATSVADRRLERLVRRPFWIWDGEFCGYITLRHLPGTTQLPLHVPGHVGYSIVPWKRGRGYATRALQLVLPIAEQAGFARLSVVCDESNHASRRVIEKAGGIYHHRGTDPSDSPDVIKLFFWVATGSDL